MNIRIRYFGMIAEATHKTEEFLQLEQGVTISELRQKQEALYPGIKTISYQVAVNQKIAAPGDTIHADCEIAFLPPFAGG